MSSEAAPDRDAKAEELLTPLEIAEQMKVSRGTVARWYREGALPGFKIGNTLRFRRADIERVMAADPAPS